MIIRQLNMGMGEKSRKSAKCSCCLKTHIFFSVTIMTLHVIFYKVHYTDKQTMQQEPTLT